jgi:hypothetical protein
MPRRKSALPPSSKDAVRPGPFVGSPSAADDDVPYVERQRALTSPGREKGRVPASQRNRADARGAAPRRRGKDPHHEPKK